MLLFCYIFINQSIIIFIPTSLEEYESVVEGRKINQSKHRKTFKMKVKFQHKSLTLIHEDFQGEAAIIRTMFWLSE